MPSISIANAAIAEGNGGGVLLTFVVTLNAASPNAAVVSWSTVDGTAIAPGDYTQVTGNFVNFLPGDTMKTVSVTVLGDTLFEADESFSVVLSNPSGATLGTAQATGTITNDDAAPVLNVGDSTVSESDAGSNLSFVVTLSRVSSTSVSVNYATTDAGSGIPGTDFASTQGGLTFAVGETTKTVLVPVLNDALNEDDETVEVRLSGSVGAPISDGVGLGLIQDNDPVPVITALPPTTTMVSESVGQVQFTLQLSAPSGRVVSASYAWFGSGATAGSDYVATAGVAVFQRGETVKALTVQVINDSVSELQESVSLSLPPGGTMKPTIGVGSAQLFINDDDQPTISFPAISVTEGNAGTTNAVFTFTLSGPTTTPVTISWNTSGAGNPGSTSGTDFIAGGGLVTFNPGETVKTITVAVVGDTLDENDEQFRLNVSVAGAGASTSAVICTILDDDASPTLSVASFSIAEGTANIFGTVNFVVSLSAASGRAVTFTIANADGTAMLGSDYATILSGTRTIVAGQTSTNIAVQIFPDSQAEPNETFHLDISNPVAATILTARGTCTLLNDD